MDSTELTRLIRNCYYDSVTQDGDYVQVVDAPKLFHIHLEMLNHAFDRIHGLETKIKNQQETIDALIKIIVKESI